MRLSLRPSTLAALAGAGAVAASLWLPWYAIDLGKAFDSAFGGTSGSAPSGPAGDFARGLVAGLLDAVPHRITATGWVALSGADVALALLAGAAVLAVLVRDVPPLLAARAVGLAGVAATAIVVVHVLHRPGPDGLVALRPGIWVALAGGVVLSLAGGLAAGRPVPAAAPVFAPRAPDPGSTTSVAPPGFAPPQG